VFQPPTFLYFRFATIKAEIDLAGNSFALILENRDGSACFDHAHQVVYAIIMGEAPKNLLKHPSIEALMVGTPIPVLTSVISKKRATLHSFSICKNR